MAPSAGPLAMTFFAPLSARTILPPLAVALGSLGAVLAASTLAAQAGGAARWALRPKAQPVAVDQPVAAAPAEIAPVLVLRGSKSVPLSELPGERRTVRIVYQGYLPAESR